VHKHRPLIVLYEVFLRPHSSGRFPAWACIQEIRPSDIYAHVEGLDWLNLMASMTRMTSALYVQISVICRKLGHLEDSSDEEFASQGAVAMLPVVCRGLRYFINYVGEQVH
jgi:hypothetical protein